MNRMKERIRRYTKQSHGNCLDMYRRGCYRLLGRLTDTVTVRTKMVDIVANVGVTGIGLLLAGEVDRVPAIEP
jgi:hypothetical protein